MSQVAARYVRVGKVSDIPVGRAEVFDVDDRKIAVFRPEDGFYAIEDICTHDGGPLAGGEIEEDHVIFLNHAATINIYTVSPLDALPVTPVESHRVRIG